MGVQGLLRIRFDVTKAGLGKQRFPLGSCSVPRAPGPVWLEAVATGSRESWTRPHVDTAARGSSSFGSGNSKSKAGGSRSSHLLPSSKPSAHPAPSHWGTAPAAAPLPSCSPSSDFPGTPSAHPEGASVHNPFNKPALGTSFSSELGLRCLRTHVWARETGKQRIPARGRGQPGSVPGIAVIPQLASHPAHCARALARASAQQRHFLAHRDTGIGPQCPSAEPCG